MTNEICVYSKYKVRRTYKCWYLEEGDFTDHEDTATKVLWGAELIKSITNDINQISDFIDITTTTDKIELQYFNEYTGEGAYVTYNIELIK